MACVCQSACMRALVRVSVYVSDSFRYQCHIVSLVGYVMFYVFFLILPVYQ